MDTIFNAVYHIGNILQGWADDSFFTLTAMTPSNECWSMLFLPIPTHGVCENRSISVELRFVFVKTGKVPDSWVKCFASTQVLSDAKMEVVKLSKH